MTTMAVTIYVSLTEGVVPSERVAEAFFDDLCNVDTYNETVLSIDGFDPVRRRDGRETYEG